MLDASRDRHREVHAATERAGREDEPTRDRESTDTRAARGDDTAERRTSSRRRAARRPLADVRATKRPHENDDDDDDRNNETTKHLKQKQFTLYITLTSL